MVSIFKYEIKAGSYDVGWKQVEVNNKRALTCEFVAIMLIGQKAVGVATSYATLSANGFYFMTYVKYDMGQKTNINILTLKCTRNIIK